MTDAVPVVTASLSFWFIRRSMWNTLHWRRNFRSRGRRRTLSLH